MNIEPELEVLKQFLTDYRKENDRGAALVAASMLDERLKEILEAFLMDGKASKDLLIGFNAPLGTFSSRTKAAFALGLIEQNEFEEMNLIRKIRNEFGHSWAACTFDSEPISLLALQLPWLGPEEFRDEATPRARFNFAVAILLTDLLWRVRLVGDEKRQTRTWSYKCRNQDHQTK